MRDWKDRLGIFASAACAVHCAATPLLVAALPTLKLTEWMTDPRFHQVVAVLCCGLVAVAILPTALRFRDLRLLTIASAGLGLIMTAAFLVPDSCCSLHASSTSTIEHTGADHSAHDHSAHDHSLSGHSHLEDHDSQSETPTLMMAGITVAQPWMTPVGGLLLILAHGLNMRRRWKSACGNPNCCASGQDVEHLKLPEQRTSETSFARAS